MRSPRFRFTLRWMMVAVATVAVTISGWQGYKRRLEYLNRARSAAETQGRFEEMLTDLLGTSNRGPKDSREFSCNGFIVRSDYRYGPHRIFCPTTADTPASEESIRGLVAACRKSIAYEAGLRRKYERAARFPWMSVEPDGDDPH